jgi:hypothetical protein
MHRSIQRYLRRHHLALVALFLALGGTSYAVSTLPAQSVGTRQLKDHAVTLVKISSTAQRSLRGRQGPRGEPGRPGIQGPVGAAGSAKAYGTVFTQGGSTPASLVQSHNATMTHPSTGVWCIKVPGVDPTKEPIIVSLSSVANFNAQVFAGFLLAPCPADTFRVRTVQVTDLAGNGQAIAADEPFVFLVP